MNGAVSEIVEWDEKTINVVDVRDGEILFSGNQQQIKDNIAAVKQRLEEKWSERQKELRELIYNLVCKQACQSMKNNSLIFDDKNYSIGFNGIEILFNNEQQPRKVNDVRFNFNQLIDDTLTNLGNLGQLQFDQDSIIGAIK